MAESATEPKKKPRTRPAKAPASDPPNPPNPAPPAADTLTFFARMGKIAKEDWGSRALLYLYRLEPVIDRLRGGDKKYVRRYAEPVDEEAIKMEHGSGRYRLVLTFRKPSAEQSSQIDNYEFDILDRAFPPKIPAGEWVDDPRNGKWAWAKDLVDGKEKPPDPMRVVNDAFDIVDRVKGGANIQPARTPAQEVKDMAAAMKDLGIVGAADKKEDAGVLAVVMQMFTAQQAQQAAVQAQLEAARQREHQTFMELLKDARKEKDEKPNGLGMVKDLFGGLKDLLPAIREIWPEAKDVVTRSVKREWWQELITDGLPIAGDVLKPFANVAAQIILSKSAPRPAVTAAIAPPTPQSPTAPGETDTAAFVRSTVVPAMLNRLPLDAPGDELGSEFAEWLADGYGTDRLQQIQSAGADWTIQYFQNSPQWQFILAICTQQKFEAFIRAFMTWKPKDEPRDKETIDAEEVVEV
jgi:hypothetical protein